jgi:hypothetical protein
MLTVKTCGFFTPILAATLENLWPRSIPEMVVMKNCYVSFKKFLYLVFSVTFKYNAVVFEFPNSDN